MTISKSVRRTLAVGVMSAAAVSTIALSATSADAAVGNGSSYRTTTDYYVGGNSDSGCLWDGGGPSGTHVTLDGYGEFWAYHQQGGFDSRGGAWYTITDSNGLCLDGGSASPGDGTKVEVLNCDGKLEQLWYLWPEGTLYEYVNHANTNYVLDAETEGAVNPSEPGDPVQLYTANYQSNQAWYPF